jgi:serpin B
VKQKLAILAVALIMSAPLLSGCRPMAGPAATAPINVVEQAGLAKTVAIEIWERTSMVSGETDTLKDEYAPRLEITDPSVIEQIVAALDVDLEPGPLAQCTSAYRLRFRLSDGTVQQFGYACETGEAAFLRGEQAFWNEMQITPPAGFDALMREQLASTAADTPASDATETPASEPTVEPPDPTRARDAALAYLTKAYGSPASELDLAWTEETTTSTGLVGSSSFRYTAGGWSVSVSFPIVAPDAVIYRVVVRNETSGFHWEGEVDARMQVTETDGPVTPSAPVAEVTEAELAELALGNRAFAFDLYQILREEEGNLFFSPYSISLALAMTYGGARDGTEAQMAEALHFTLPQDRLHPAFDTLDQILASRGEGAEGKDGEGFRLNVVNALWGQEGYDFLPAFLDLLAENYGAGMRLVDFINSSEQARITINDWASDETEGRIQDLIPPGILNSLTRLVLTNAIYFNAAWAEPFEPKLTRDGPFYLIDGSEVTVPMMRQTTSLGYAEGEGYQAVELPYDGGELSMVILLPEAGGLAAFEDSLDAGQLDAIMDGLAYQQVALTLPKFEFDSDFSLSAALSRLGMPVAFSSDADFSGMTGNRELFIAEVLHKAFVSVDEAGTEAAAATAVMMQLTMAPESPPEVKVDHPFLFLIRDLETGTILFVGRVVDPNA